MKLKKVLVLIFFLISLIFSAAAAEHAPLTFQLGVFDEQGFFSNYAGFSAEALIHLNSLKVGINQKMYHGFMYDEWIGQTNLLLYLHDSIYINLGVSYLLKESPTLSSTDFGNGPLPVLGFGFAIPTKNPHIVLTPSLQMNQSFYLSDSIRPRYADLPFLIAMTLGLSVNYLLY